MPAGAVMSQFMRSAMNGEPIEVYNGGIPSSDLVYVTDVSRLIVAAVQSGDCGVYNAGSGVATSAKELAETVRALFPGAKNRNSYPRAWCRLACELPGLVHDQNHGNVATRTYIARRWREQVQTLFGAAGVRVAVFSDVHGNLPALEVFVKSTRGQVDMYVCLGDVVDYGPWNDECLEMTMGLPNIVLLEGN